MGNEEEQREELEVLHSIYENDVLNFNESTRDGQCHVQVVLPQPFIVLLHPEGGLKQALEVCFLPPITVHFRLPKDYPSKRPPEFVLACDWLTRAHISLLCQQLDRLWDESKPEVVLFRWIQFLQKDTLSYLSIRSQLDITPLVSTRVQGNFGNIMQARKRMFDLSEAPIEEKCTVAKENVSEQTHKSSRVRPAIEIAKNHLTSGSIDKKKEDALEGRKKGKGRGRGQRELGTLQQRTGQNSHDVHMFNMNDVKEQLLLDEQFLSSGGDPRAVVILRLPELLLPFIVEFNECKQKEMFEKDWFACKVCMTESLGSQCLQFVGCHHVFCKGCMQVYFEVQIKEGNVKRLTCPEEKCSSQATPAQVFELVGQTLFERYDRMLLESSLATMGDVTYCPRKSCQFTVIKDPMENHATCQRCFFVFCHYCRKTYHGIAPCSFQHDEKIQIIEEYRNGSSTVKLELEKRYGKKQLLSMIENAMSEKWVKDCTKSCPQCSASIQKVDGCNKMVCWCCNTYFCWLCKRKLDSAAPYLHFNDTKSRCFNLLFEGTEDLEDGDDWEFGQFI